MAQFEGTHEEFLKFFGGYARNKVHSLSKKKRSKTSHCQKCKKHKSKLEAAHISGRERPIIIGEILLNFMGKDKTVKIDLNTFEELFEAAHNPLEDTIMMLCKECHHDYDHPNKKNNSINDADIDTDTDYEALEKKEILLLDEFIGNSKMNKGIAMVHAGNSVLDDINSKNTIYSNQNKTKDNWWLEPSLEKFKSDLFMILNKPKQNKLLVFKIPKDTIYNPEVIFFQRSDKNAAKFLIPISDTKYLDTKGFDFTPYLIKEMSY